MKISIDREKFKIYLRIGIAYFLLSAFGELFNDDYGTFFKRVWNNVWLLCYIVVLNYMLYEFALPYIKFTWRRLLVVPVLLFAIAILCSFVFYVWRSIGVALHLYFPVTEPASISERLEQLVPFSFFSVFFFGTVKHVYDYRKLKTDTQQLRIE